MIKPKPSTMDQPTIDPAQVGNGKSEVGKLHTSHLPHRGPNSNGVNQATIDPKMARPQQNPIDHRPTNHQPSLGMTAAYLFSSDFFCPLSSPNPNRPKP